MNVLDQVKNSDPVAYGRQQAGAIGVEEQVAFAIDSAQEIGELAKRSVRLRNWQQQHWAAYLEIGLHYFLLPVPATHTACLVGCESVCR